MSDGKEEEVEPEQVAEEVEEVPDTTDTEEKSAQGDSSSDAKPDAVDTSSARAGPGNGDSTTGGMTLDEPKPGVHRPGLLNHLFWPDLDENEEEEWMRVRAPFIIHPDCNFSKYWDVLSMILIIFSCVTIPKRLAFGIEPKGFDALFDRFVDGIFMFDCVLTFRKAVKPSDELITGGMEIAKLYFKGWFILDFMSSFPFDVVLSAGGDENAEIDPATARLLKMIRIFRMVKILRMVRIHRLLKKMQDELSIKNGVMISIKFTIFTMLASHFIACLWYYIGIQTLENNWALHYCVWQDQDNYNENCPDICRRQTCCMICTERTGVGNVTEHFVDTGGCHRNRVSGLEPTYEPYQDCLTECKLVSPGDPAAAVVRGCDTGSQYTASFYYALVTMTTIGYGDIVPKNTDERQAATCFILIGASIFAYAITNMCTVVHNLNPSDVFNRGRMDELNDYMSFLHLPSVLKKKSMEYYFYKTERSEGAYFNQSSILASMSRAQARDMIYLLRHKGIDKVPVFEDLPKDMIGDLCARLKSHVVAPDDVLCRQGDIAHDAFIINIGALRLERNGIPLATLADGSMISLAAIFTHARVGFSAIAVEFSDIFGLSHAVFQQLCGFYNINSQTVWAKAVALGTAKFDESDYWCSRKLDADGNHVVTDVHVVENPLADEMDSEIVDLEKRILFQKNYIAMLTDATAGMNSGEPDEEE